MSEMYVATSGGAYAPLHESQPHYGGKPLQRNQGQKQMEASAGMGRGGLENMLGQELKLNQVKGFPQSDK